MALWRAFLVAPRPSTPAYPLDAASPSTGGSGVSDTNHVRVPMPIAWAAGLTVAMGLSATTGLAVWLSQPVCDADCRQYEESKYGNPEGRCDNADLVLGKRSFQECAKAEEQARQTNPAKDRAAPTHKPRPFSGVLDREAAKRSEYADEEAGKREPHSHDPFLTPACAESMA